MPIGRSWTFIVLVPIWIGLFLVFQQDYSGVTAANLLLAVPAIVLGFAINFFMGAVITCVGFWTTRVYALSEFVYGFNLLLGGSFVPLDLLPAQVQRIALALPFQLFLYFPIELILGKLSPAEIRWNFGMQALWLGIVSLAFYLTWREGVKRFSAVGA